MTRGAEPWSPARQLAGGDRLGSLAAVHTDVMGPAASRHRAFAAAPAAEGVAEVSDGLQWARTFSELARELVEAPSTRDTLGLIAERATAVTGCRWAAITRVSDQDPVVAAVSDPAFSEQIAAIQAAGGGGPTWEAIRTTTTVEVPDLDHEDRWPDHVRNLREQTPVRSILSFCLHIDHRPPLGALTLYADHPHGFPAEAAATASVYADHAAIALDHARIEDRAENLTHALATNREIGMAIGILIERYKVTPEQGFDLLRTASQHSGRKLHHIAAHLVHTGQLDNTCGAQ